MKRIDIQLTDYSMDPDRFLSDASKLLSGMTNMAAVATAPAAEDAFGINDDATYGDLAGALYVMIGGSPNAGEEAPSSPGSAVRVSGCMEGMK